MKSIFSRIAYSLWHHKRRNILISGWFFLLLFLLISVTIISIASNQQVVNLNSNVGNCVIMKKVSDIDTEMEGPFNSKEIEKLNSLSFVKSCNAVGFHSGRLIDAVSVVKDNEMNDVNKKSLKQTDQSLDSCMLFGLTNTQIYTLFTSAGFKLTEGKHITAEDSGKKVAVISTSLAEANNLKLGDTISVTTPYMIEQLEGKKEPITLTVTGLFDYPRTSNLYEKTVTSAFPSEQPANYIFVPGDILSAYSTWYGPLRLYVYMQDSNQVENFINDIKIELGDSTYDPIYWTLLYDYTWDKDWVSTVNKPAEEISSMATAAALGLGISIFVIILLIYALLLNRKKYELGVFLSLGESKPKLVLQTVLEELALVLAALIMAALLAVLVAPAVSNLVMEKPASETNAAIEHQRDEIVRYENHGDYVVEGDIKSARTTYFYVNNELNVSGSFGVFIAYTFIGIVVIFVALAGQVLFFLRKSPARLLLSN